MYIACYVLLTLLINTLISYIVTTISRSKFLRTGLTWLNVT